MSSTDFTEGEVEIIKRCRNCKKDLPASSDYFHRYKRSPDGFKNNCIDCRTKHGRRKKWDGTLDPSQPSKLCNACNTQKPLSEFAKEEFGLQGRRGKCKICENKRRTELRNGKRDSIVKEIKVSGKTKVCTKCKKEKPIEVFGVRKISKKCPTGYSSHCNPCSSLVSKEYKQRKRLGLVGKKEILSKGQKRCKRCKKIKSHSEFHKDKSREDGCFPWCKECKSKDQLDREEKARQELGIKKRITEKWDKKTEEIFISAFKEGQTIEQIQKKYFKKRSLTSLKAKALRLGLRSPIIWTDDDDKLLEEIFKKDKDYKEIQKKFPERSILSLKSRCWKLNLTDKKSRPWTLKEDSIVKREVSKGKTIKEFLSLLPNRTQSGVNGRIQILGLKAIEIRKEIRAEKISKLTSQECIECDLEKPIDDFYRTGTGFMLVCKECRHLRFADYREKNKSRLSKWQKAQRQTLRKESANKLNDYYINHEVPQYIWHEKEFPTEEDFQKALEHTLVNHLKLRIEPWIYLEGIGYPDIYIPEMDLIIEVKLVGDVWSSNHIEDQVLKYQEISPVIIVSLDGKPKKWDTAICDWFTPEDCFEYLQSYSITPSDES